MLSTQLQQRAALLSKAKRNFADEAERAGFDFGQWGSDLSTCLAMLIPALTVAKADQKETFDLLRHKIIEGHARGAKEREQRQRSNVHGRPAATLEVKAASEFKMRAIEWFWQDRFPRGKLSLLGGLPDKGKGLFGSFLSACATARVPLPMNEGFTPQGSVVYLSQEDDPEDTIVPRLAAAGADLSRVYIVRMMQETDGRKRTFSMLTDLEALRAKIDEIGDVVLVIIDPISAYVGVGKVNSSMASDVRGFLQPFCDLAAEKRLVLLGVMHLNKKADVGSAMLRFSDSIAYPALARSVYMVADDTEVKGQRIFARVKGNLGPDKKALTFGTNNRLIGVDDNDKEIRPPFLEWGMKYVEITANEAMQAESGGNSGRIERREAKQFLQEQLAEGPMKQVDLIAEAEAAGISKATLNRAKKDLGVKSKKGNGLDQAWTWEMPT